jgi:uncharacterized glyoxalase superfamily protein PhnB
MKLAATVIYVDNVPSVLDFYRRAFALEPDLVDLDVQLPGRRAGGRYQFASLATEGGTLQFGTHDLGNLLMPGYSRPDTGRPSGIEIAFYTSDVDGSYRRAVDAGAEPLAEPRSMPWGQKVAYVRSVEGTFVGICTPPTP